ncbi:MAG: hypothetical protein JXJ20_12940 [Anaerolineae bacterium]|nr:hypothetical protein [Anaerolineae bacterium]
MRPEHQPVGPVVRANEAANELHGAGRQQVFAWLALCVTGGLVIVLYVSLSLSVSADPLLMPLDDTYIHFQYARQLAQGEPMVYNPGDPATSGGTSLLYPPLLALGYVLGFDGWSLAQWALGTGALCFLGSAWLVYLIARDNPLLNGRRQPGYALWLALAYALAGPFVWAALSGMESALVLFAALLTFYAVQRDRFRLATAAAILLTLTRPEGAILSGLAVLALALRLPWPPDRAARGRRVMCLALPLLAALVQPVINVLATVDVSSNGMLAKSHLYNTGASMRERLLDTLEFFGRMWSELLRGTNPDVGLYTSPLLAGVALIGLVVGGWLAWRRRRLNAAVLALVWIIALTAAVATLDTAFWQFKRYQLPVMALLFPAAAWTVGLAGDWLERRGLRRLRWALPALILLPSAYTTITFARNYAENVTVVRDQQVPMAEWAADNLPEDARIGAHDVGLVRYFGERDLYDVVGLTTPGPARSWRQGPGAIYEHMASSDYRPDYFAIYPDVQGLRYLLDAGVFGDVLAEFPIDLPPHNVAAATGYQAVYVADWSTTRPAEHIAQPTTLEYVAGLALVDQVDVANLDSEADHRYRWWSDKTPPGFVTEVYRHVYHACALDEADCWATDGGRVITGGETFTLRTRQGEDLLLVTRLHGRASVPLAVSVNDRRLTQRVQPSVPGRWLEVVTWVPADRITGSETVIRIEPQITDPTVEAYLPYYHWAYQGIFEPQEAGDAAPIATFGQAGAVRLLDYSLTQQAGSFEVGLTWLGDAPGTGDGVVFVHLYGDTNAEPVAQTVSRPAGGVLPPGNWLPGPIQDVYTVTVQDDLPPGQYAVAIGLYDARTGIRYPVSGEGADSTGRLFIGVVTIRE